MNKNDKDIWFIYIIETENNKLYTGITKDLDKRFQKHKSGQGAKFLRVNKPKKIVYFEKTTSKSLALKREHAIKKLSRKQKLELIN